MKAKIILIALTLVLAFTATIALAVDRVPAQTQSGKTVVVPPHAVELAPGLFDLGTAVVDGKVVQGYMFIDYRQGFAKPGGGGTSGTNCFAFLAKGARWKSLENWVVNPSNVAGLDGTFVFNNLAFDIQKWEDAAVKNILGDGTTTAAALVADTVSPDSLNEVYFADVASPGAIAVTIVWGIFGGPPFARELVEWDQVYDDVDFAWSSAGEAGKMDFENIATHELGHSVGMGHPSDSCTEETMYRFADFGETKKRDLNTGDIAGVKKLYG